MFSEENLSKQGKKQQSIGRKSSYSNTSSGFEYKKNCLSKLSITMFIKRETRAGKAYAYLMLLSLETPVAYIFLKFMLDNCPS